MIQGHGPSLSQGWVGNLMNVSNDRGMPPATRLYNLWLQQNLFDDVLSVRAGMMNVDAEFMTSQTASLFMNGRSAGRSGRRSICPAAVRPIRCRRRACA